MRTGVESASVNTTWVAEVELSKNKGKRRPSGSTNKQKSIDVRTVRQDDDDQSFNL